MEEAINRIKIAKAPGVDKVAPKMVKCIRKRGKEKLRKLIINLCWWTQMEINSKENQKMFYRAIKSFQMKPEFKKKIEIENRETVNGIDITRDEIEEATNRIKNANASGLNAVAPEMVKYIGERGKEELRKLINLCWKKKTDTRRVENRRNPTNI